jgi:ABC-type uncharacterized transport system substrate-binding protein
MLMYQRFLMNKMVFTHLKNVLILQKPLKPNSRRRTMTQDEILQMARQAGFESHDVMINHRKELVRFYALAIAHEREACAQLCEDLWEDDGTAWDCAVAIESRGNK